MLTEMDKIQLQSCKIIFKATGLFWKTVRFILLCVLTTASPSGQDGNAVCTGDGRLDVDAVDRGLIVEETDAVDILLDMDSVRRRKGRCGRSPPTSDSVSSWDSENQMPGNLANISLSTRFRS